MAAGELHSMEDSEFTRLDLIGIWLQDARQFPVINPSRVFCRKERFLFLGTLQKLPLWTADATVQGQASTFQLWQLFGAARRHN